MPAHVARFWIIVAIITALTIWAIAPVLAPFVWGVALAYLLRPACRGLERLGFQRWAAAATIIGGFFVIALATMAFLAPFLWSQALSLAIALPSAATRISALLREHWDTLREHIDPATLARAQAASAGYLEEVGSAAGSVLRGILSSGFAIVDLAMFAILMPMVGYYILIEWDRIVAWVDDLLPARWAPEVRDHVRQIDGVVSAWVRWQSIVCLILAAYYAVALGMTGLRFGVLIGICTGLLAFVPFVGFMTGLVACIAAAALTFDSWHGWAAVGGVLVVGNILDGWVLIPKLLGRKLGLNDVWVLLALLVGGHLLGLLGIALAVPGAAVAGVMLGSAVARYRASSYRTAGGDVAPGGGASYPARDITAPPVG